MNKRRRFKAKTRRAAKVAESRISPAKFSELRDQVHIVVTPAGPTKWLAVPGSVESERMRKAWSQI